MLFCSVYNWHWILFLHSILALDESVTLSMSAASLRLWAMSSDSVSRSSSRMVLYNWPTSSLCRQSFTWFTRKCITAFGTLEPNNNNQEGRWNKEKGSKHIRMKISKMTRWQVKTLSRIYVPVLDVFPNDKKVWLNESLDNLTVPLLPSRQLPGYWNRLAMERHQMCLLMNILMMQLGKCIHK